MSMSKEKYYKVYFLDQRGEMDFVIYKAKNKTDAGIKGNAACNALRAIAVYKLKNFQSGAAYMPLKIAEEREGKVIWVNEIYSSIN